MKLPPVEDVMSPTAMTLRWWDLREYFSRDPKDFWTIHYRHRLNAILGAAKTFMLPGGTILDIGCAQATASLLLAEQGYRVIAVDANADCLRYARQRYERGDCAFVSLDVLHGAGVDALRCGLDGILLGEVLEHVPQPGRLLKACIDKLRPEGVLIVTTPNGASPHNWRFRGYRAEMERQEGDAPRSGLGGRSTHLFNFRLPQLLMLLRSLGLVIRKHAYLNSYAINPLGLHRVLPVEAAASVNAVCARVPALAQYSTMTLFVVAQKRVPGESSG